MMKDNAFAMTIKELKNTLDVGNSNLEVLLSRSHYAQFETNVKMLTKSGKLRSARAYCITPEFIELLMVDVENSGMMKRKMKNGNKDENRIKC